ncbi:unnamed protein product [Didymodactylos carnosus]|uniref:Uncharacterized protein n=1 Tax=Didymodactylos carnosus TaxID=1234261 RepID=A0A814Z9L4_9BILA|nr:unnamed protein product [Didymodactylos carnosus]CAF4001559.1 unnamed protein product [Didymodactylos carnosus]
MCHVAYPDLSSCLVPSLLNNQKPKFYRGRHVATPTIVCRIITYINKKDPPTISLIAEKCHISASTTFHVIRDIIHAKYRKTRPLHR